MVRRAAIETLEQFGPVKDALEGKLLADLAALRGGDAHICVAANLPYTYGRDPRVLKYCGEVLHAGNEMERTMAVSTLCCLGEADVALLAAHDSSPKVRATLCQRLGFYREDRAVEHLQRLLNDPDSEVAKEAKTALRRLGRLEKAKLLASPEESEDDSAWRKLLREISRVRLSDSEVAVEVPDEMVEAGWLGNPGAKQEQIEEAERRLGVRFPASYREFLAESNGFEQLTSFISKLYGTDDVDWFRARNADWIAAYDQVTDDISPEEHREFRDLPERFRTAYLSACLQISEVGDSAVVLLNPEVSTADGEWETWFLANWLPGASRYPSFREYMESELESNLQLSKNQKRTSLPTKLFRLKSRYEG